MAITTKNTAPIIIPILAPIEMPSGEEAGWAVGVVANATVGVEPATVVEAEMNELELDTGISDVGLTDGEALALEELAMVVVLEGFSVLVEASFKEELAPPAGPEDVKSRVLESNSFFSSFTSIIRRKNVLVGFSVKVPVVTCQSQVFVSLVRFSMPG